MKYGAAIPAILVAAATTPVPLPLVCVEKHSAE